MPQKKNPLAELHEKLVTYFNVSELQDLCFKLRLDYDDLPGSTKSDKARELINFLIRRRRLPELLELLPVLRPQVPWSEIPEPFLTTLLTDPKTISNYRIIIGIAFTVFVIVVMLFYWGNLFAFFRPTQPAQSVTPTSPSGELITLATIAPTLTSTSTDTPTLIPTFTSTPTLTNTPTPTPTPTPTNTSTPNNIPTLPPSPSTSMPVDTSFPGSVSLQDCVITTKFGATLESEPDMQNSVTLAELAQNQQYESSYRSDEFPTWFYVVHNGQGGWVSSQYLIVGPTCTSISSPEDIPSVSLEGCVITTKFGATLESEPDMQNSVTLAELAQNQQYESSRRSDEFPTWFYIVHNGQGGWVSSQYLIVNAVCSS